MAGNHLFIRLDLSNGIGPGKIALLEAIRAEGSILAASRHFGMSYGTHGPWPPKHRRGNPRRLDYVAGDALFLGAPALLC
jgi:hypothetical protein